MYKLSFIKITSGELFDYLKDIDIVGKINDDGSFIVFGCKNEHQDKFYAGIFEYDKVTEIQGFKKVEEAKHWWEEVADMTLYVDKGNYEVLEIE
jgi:hypothetical protein